MELTLDTYAATDVGRKRGHNEDFFFVSDDLSLYVVADGMGGHAAGEVASHKAIVSISEFIRSVREDDGFTWPFGVDRNLSEHENLLITAIRIANHEISAMADENSEYHGMGTTIACLTLNADKAVVAHVGDSRAYRWRDGVLTQMTNDHSWVNEQVARNIITEEEARNHRWRNVITRALGNKRTVDIDLSQTDVQQGDIFLLCSDGLSSMITNDEIAAVLNLPEATSRQMVSELIQQANEAGGLDNITALIIRVLNVPDTDALSDDGQPHADWSTDATAPRLNMPNAQDASPDEETQ